MTYGNKKEYAAHRGVTPAYVSKKGIKELIEQAMEIDPSDGKRKINFEKANAIIANAADPARAEFKKENLATDKSAGAETKPPAAGPAPGSYHDGKTRLAQINAEKAELDMLERKKQIMPVAGTIQALNAAGSTIKEFLQARNTRLSEEAASMTNPREIKAMLDADDRAMFEAINDDFQRRIEKYTGGESTLSH